MNPLCLVACALLSPAPASPNAANGVLIPLERETYVRQVPFTSYRLGAYALGYEFRKADMTYVGDPQAPGGRRAARGHRHGPACSALHPDSAQWRADHGAIRAPGAEAQDF